MSDIINRRVLKYPNARATTVQYLAKREEMTQRLRSETERYQKEAMAKISKKPRWSLLRWIWGR